MQRLALPALLLVMGLAAKAMAGSIAIGLPLISGEVGTFSVLREPVGQMGLCSIGALFKARAAIRALSDQELAALSNIVSRT